MDMIGAKTEEQIAKLQEFIDNMYKSIGSKDIAIVPQQKVLIITRYTMVLQMVQVWKKSIK